MKKLTFLLITFLIIYLIYSLFSIDKVNYVSISDEVMNYNQFMNRNKIANFNDYFIRESIIKAYQDIKNNRTIRIDNKDYYMKKVLRESDILVISVGMMELANNFNKYNMPVNYAIFSTMYDNIERLVKEIKKYAFGKVIFLGYFNPTNYYDANIDRFFYDIDIKLERLMIDNNIVYIDLYELIKGNNYKEKNSYSLNIEGNRKIANIIEFYLN